MDKMKYSVCLLFNSAGSRILLQQKDRTVFTGMLNGIGGKIEDGEKPEDGVLREIREETTIRAEDISKLTWLGTLALPDQCDERYPLNYPELWFYAGILKDDTAVKKADNATEHVKWYRLSGNHPVTELRTAGDGDLEYFIGRARRVLFNEQ